jgi:LuxR family transcriptional regulator, maltose regulon positive regulatory protein
LQSRGFSSPLPLVGAKMARPQATRSGVDRRRLFALLDAGIANPVTLVNAGASWGKTMLVSAWAQTCGTPVAWLSLDRHDNDPLTFWTYVVTALQTAGVLPDGNPLADLSSVPKHEGERARRLADGLGRLTGRTVLVLDDFHEIDDDQVLGELSGLLRHPPPGLPLILVSRARPALALHRLRTAGQITEIGAPELAFTGDETAALLRAHGLVSTAQDIVALLARTEGWAAGLQIGAGFLTGGDGARSVADFTGDARDVHDYLNGEVLAGRSRRQRRFLLLTSICERVCADLADEITAQHDGQRTLEQLENDNDFVVRLGAKPLWFRYHPLLREALSQNLLREPSAAVTELHRRAARWFVGRNSVLEALAHAVAARDWKYVGRVVTGQAATLMLSAHRQALVDILEQVPRDQLTTTAELMVCDAVLLFHAGDYDAIPARLNRAREQLRRRSDGDSRRPLEIVMLLLQLAGDRAVGDIPAVVAGCDDLLALLTAGDVDAGVAARFRAIALSNRGVGRLWSGHPEAAVRDLGVATGAARTVGLELVEINAAGHLALLEALCGSVDEAGRLAAGARDLAERRGWQHAMQVVAAHLAHALVHLERHDLPAAREALRMGSRAHYSDPEAAQRVILFGLQARLAVLDGDAAQARLLVEQARRDRSPRTAVPALDGWLTLIEAEADVVAGQPELTAGRFAGEDGGLPQRVAQARAALELRDLRLAERLLARRPAVLAHTAAAVEAGLLRALVADIRGQASRAGDLLAGAVRLAEREGIRRPFLTCADDRLTELMRRSQVVDAAAAPFLDQLVTDIRGSRLPVHDPAVERLSERETDVLRCLPTMLTAGQIAVELGISVNTVKAHMRSIYRKLGAGRRSEAVVKARDAGLL